MRITTILCWGLLILVPVRASSDVVPGGNAITFYVIGVGQDSCGKYLRAADAERKARPSNADPDVLYSMQFVTFVSYVNGFLTGANFMAGAYHLPQGSMVGKKSEMDGRMVWLENYCKSHPLNDFSDAVFNLMAGLANENR